MGNVNVEVQILMPGKHGGKGELRKATQATTEGRLRCGLREWDSAAQAKGAIPRLRYPSIHT